MAAPGTHLLIDGKCVGYEKLTVDNTVKSLTVPTDADRALMVLEDGKIRFRMDGTAPTASEGLPFAINDSYTVMGEFNLANFKAIRTDAASGTLYILYFRRNLP